MEMHNNIKTLVHQCEGSRKVKVFVLRLDVLSGKKLTTVHILYEPESNPHRPETLLI